MLQETLRQDGFPCRLGGQGFKCHLPGGAPFPLPCRKPRLQQMGKFLGPLISAPAQPSF